MKKPSKELVDQNWIYDYNKICDEIKQIDTKIKFTVINERGRLVTG